MKYPRTLHLPWSQGTTKDDKILKDDSQFKGKYVVVTEKLDGENTSMHSDKVHARSTNQTKHTSRNVIKALHSSVKHGIPEGFQVVGENVYAKHSIPYLELTSFFYVFGVIDTKQGRFLSWDDTYRFVAPLGLQLVPVIYDGMYEDFEPPKFPFPSAFGDEAEGYVVRSMDSFSVEDFSKCVAKCVRRDHVTTDKHWTTSWVPNILKPII